MQAFVLGLRRILPALIDLLKRLPWLLPLLLPFLRALLVSICRCFHRPDRGGCCIDIPPNTHVRADPMLYAQYWLMKQGLSVTWDNPDIQIYDAGGIPASPYGLSPDTDYKVVVRVWNNSYDGPAAGLPVELSYLTFGIATTSTAVGKTFVNLGVKGSSHCPVFAQFVWHTPAQEGHYCLQALLLWSDDANPENNLGQKNTQVGTLHSPAKFKFPVHNRASVRRQLDLEPDMYRLPRLPPCGDTPPRKDRRPSRLAESQARWEWARQTQGFGLFPVTAAWIITIEPNHFWLAPDQSQDVEVTIDSAQVPFIGTATFNIHGFATPPGGTRVPVGGVTLSVEGS
jgi:hypothetical protein